MFRSDGGFTRHVETNRKIGEFQRGNGVYRMEVEVDDENEVEVDGEMVFEEDLEEALPPAVFS